MENNFTVYKYAGFALALLLFVGWCSHRALRRGESVAEVILKALFSLALAGGLAFFNGKNWTSSRAI